MTLLKLISDIERIASEQPCINAIVRDSVLNVNKVPDNKYGTFVWTQGQHSGGIGTDWQTFRFTLFYIDRVTADGGNVPEVQSVGVTCLANIARSIAEELGLDTLDWTIDTFTHRFTDNCAGAYMTVALPVMQDSICAERYEGLPYLLTAEGWKVIDASGAFIIVRE